MEIAAFYENILAGVKQRGCTLQEAITELRGAGLQRLYLSGRTFANDEAAIMDLCRENGLVIEGLYDFFDFLHHPEDTGYERLVDSAVRAGAKNVMVIIGMLPPEEANQRDALFANAKQVLTRAVAYSNARGVAFSMEDFDNLNSPVCTIEGLNWFLTEVEGLQCSFDTGNFVLYHQDELEAFELMKDKICTLHLKDRGPVQHFPEDLARICADGEALYSAPLGQGIIRIREILRRLIEMNYPGNVIAELFDYADSLSGIAQSITWLRKTIEELQNA